MGLYCDEKESTVITESGASERCMFEHRHVYILQKSECVKKGDNGIESVNESEFKQVCKRKKPYPLKRRLKHSLKVFRYTHSFTGSFPSSSHFCPYNLYILILDSDIADVDYQHGSSVIGIVENYECVPLQSGGRLLASCCQVCDVLSYPCVVILLLQKRPSVLDLLVQLRDHVCGERPSCKHSLILPTHW